MSTTTKSPSALPDLRIDVSAIAQAQPRVIQPANNSANAQVKAETTAQGRETFGVLNQHPSKSDSPVPYSVGVSVDKNKKCRRTMEDAHSFIYDFGGISGQGYFAVFDGHAGKHAAEWCGEHFHEHLLSELLSSPQTPIPSLLNQTFHAVDKQLSDLAQAENTHSGCTAVVAFLRLEDEAGNPIGTKGGCGGGVQILEDGMKSLGISGAAVAAKGEGDRTSEEAAEEKVRSSSKDAEKAAGPDSTSASATTGTTNDTSKRERVKQAFKDLVSSSSSPSSTSALSTSSPSSSLDNTPARSRSGEPSTPSSSVSVAPVRSPLVEIQGPAEVKTAAKRTLYTANVGDARAVLCRGGRAVRLTYDHKGSDEQEAKRITDAGGFVMNNRVNGVLAVTRSLGDSSMKEFVVGSPYTTETTLGDEDEFLIVACDGLWDVCQDQEAIDIVKALGTKNAQDASKALLEHALSNFSTDNLSVLVVSLQ